jgi:hypothetical protein
MFSGRCKRHQRGRKVEGLGADLRQTAAKLAVLDQGREQQRTDARQARSRKIFFRRQTDSGAQLRGLMERPLLGYV